MAVSRDPSLQAAGMMGVAGVEPPRERTSLKSRYKFQFLCPFGGPGPVSGFVLSLLLLLLFPARARKHHTSQTTSLHLGSPWLRSFGSVCLAGLSPVTTARAAQDGALEIQLIERGFLPACHSQLKRELGEGPPWCYLPQGRGSCPNTQAQSTGNLLSLHPLSTRDWALQER